MDRREFGWVLGAWLGYSWLQQQQRNRKQETITCTVRAVDGESFREFMLRDNVKVDLGVPGMPTTGHISAIEERFSGELAEVRYRVDLDGPGYQRIWLSWNSLSS